MLPFPHMTVNRKIVILRNLISFYKFLVSDSPFFSELVLTILFMSNRKYRYRMLVLLSIFQMNKNLFDF